MISAVVLAKNEEKNIKACLKSLDWCEEAVVIDDFSQDKTAQIAQKMGAKVFKRHLNKDFASQRNFGLEKAKGNWVLFVDADERVTDKLAKEINRAIKDSQISGFYLKRSDFFGGRKLRYGETAQVRLLRLGRRGAGKWQRCVHETWEIKGTKGQLKETLLHYPHQTISQFLKEINFYSTLNAQAFLKQGKRAGLIQILAYPLAKFIQNYFIRFGFLDKTPGMVVALMMSFHSFLTRAKLYLLWKKGAWWEAGK
jgi:glycosyltransferase involved in cell wall biosynthesis